MDRKRILFIVGIILIIILGIIAINISKNKKTEEKDNLNENLLKDTTVENLTITNQTVNAKEGSSNYIAIVTNNSNVNYQINKLYVIFTVDNKEIKALLLYDMTLSPGDSIPVSVTVDEDITKATNVTYRYE